MVNKKKVVKKPYKSLKRIPKEIKVRKTPFGRPTKYRDSFVAELDNYLATTGKEQTTLPTKQGFALWLNVDEDTLNNWAVKHKDFFGALSKLMLIQAEQLISDGIYGGKEVNSTIVKLLLQNNHGMKERVDNTSKDEKIETNSIVFTNFKNDSKH